MIEMKKLTTEGAILNEIREAKKLNKKIVKLGIPIKLQNKLSALVDTSHNLVDYLKLKEIYGIPVEDSEKLTITTEFGHFVSI